MSNSPNPFIDQGFELIPGNTVFTRFVPTIADILNHPKVSEGGATWMEINRGSDQPYSMNIAGKPVWGVLGVSEPDPLGTSARQIAIGMYCRGENAQAVVSHLQSHGLPKFFFGGALALPQSARITFGQGEEISRVVAEYTVPALAA